jgi:hypothetical protein
VLGKRPHGVFESLESEVRSPVGANSTTKHFQSDRNAVANEISHFAHIFLQAVDWCVGLLHNNPSFQYDIAMLIKFGFLKESLPAGAQVVSAKMSLTIYPEGENIRLIGRYLLQPWLNVSGPIGSNVGVGWRFRSVISR